MAISAGIILKILHTFFWQSSPPRLASKRSAIKKGLHGDRGDHDERLIEQVAEMLARQVGNITVSQEETSNAEI
jgi:hypothetical protein